jgi:hypothetical protein
MKCSLYSLYVLKNQGQGPIWLAIYGKINVDGLAKSPQTDGTAKSSRCKAREA